MANSTISTTFKLKADVQDFKALLDSSEGLKKSLEGVVEKAEQVNTKTNFKALAMQFAPVIAGAAAAGTAFSKFAKDAINMTQTWGDQWAAETEGIRQAYGIFVRQLSSGEGWKDLFANMGEAYRRGKELASGLDELFERNISMSYTEASGQLQLSRLQLIMRDSSKSDAERESAAREYLDLTQKIASQKQALAADEALIYRDNFKSQTSLNDEETDFLLKEYNLNRQIIKQATEYNEAKKDLTTSGKVYNKGSIGGVDFKDVLKIGEYQRNLAELEATTDESVKRVAEMLTKYNKISDAEVSKMAEAEIKVIQLETEANRSSVRATSTLGSLIKSQSKTASATVNLQDKIQAAVDVNKVFNAGLNEQKVIMGVLEAEIKSLIGKYGLEGEQVQNLISQYNLLKIAKSGINDTPLEKLPEITSKATTQGGNQLAGTNPAGENYSAQKKYFEGISKGASDAASSISALSNVMSGLSDVVSESSKNWLSWIANLMRAIATAVPAINILSAAHKKKANAEMADAVAGGASSVAGIPMVGPAMAVAAGATIITAILSAISSIPKFANGGIAYGPTLGLFGEYSGASHNPEVVAPLDRLRTLIAPQQAGVGEVEFKISGRNLVGILNTESSIRSRG